MAQITTLSLFKYKGLRSKIWAFGMMQFAHSHLAKAKGLNFYKLMGSGKGIGFNPLPDWSTYALLATWSSEEKAEAFIHQSALFNHYNLRTEETATLFLKCIKSHGEWSSKQPFQISENGIITEAPLLVITRATIKTKYLFRFWKYVPKTAKPITSQEGLWYKKGIGEVPISQMATVSIWSNEYALRQYAYENKAHQKAIQMTRKLGWYSEELFARFTPYKMIGSLKDLEKLQLWLGNNSHKT